MKELGAETLVWAQMQLRPDIVDAAIVAATVEPGAICNLRCPFCATGTDAIGLSREFLRIDAFKRILDALGPRLRELRLFNWGESLLNPDVYDMFSESKRRKISVWLSATLSSVPADRFAADHAERLVRSGPDLLTLSCDGASQETYQAYRAGGSFDRVMTNLRALLDAKRRSSSDRPEIIWQFLLHKKNERDAPAATELAAQLGIPIIFRRLIVPGPSIAEWATAVDKASVREVRRGSGTASPPAADDTLARGRVCLAVWTDPVVHSDGTVLPCCAVSSAEYSLGNIFYESLRAIWNKPLIVAMRRYLRTGHRSEVKLPCYGCPLSPHAAP